MDDIDEICKEVIEKKKKQNEAIGKYEEAGRFEDAAEAARRAGLIYRACRNYKKAIEKYEEEGRFGDAYKLHEELSFIEKDEFWQ